MQIGEILFSGLMQWSNIKFKRRISPSADLTPVYVGKFGFLGTQLLEKIQPIDSKILVVVATVLTGMAYTRKGIDAFKWIPEFLVPFGNVKIQERLIQRYLGADTWHKNEDDRKILIFFSVLLAIALGSVTVYLQYTRNPKRSLKANLLYLVATQTFSGIQTLYQPTTKDYCKKITEDYPFEGYLIQYYAIGFLFKCFATKFIEKGFGQSLHRSLKYECSLAITRGIVMFLKHSPNSPLAEKKS